jgi:tetratricopeptide (TPR) repeat protein
VVALAGLLAGCPGGGDVRDDVGDDGPDAGVGAGDAADGGVAGRPPLEPVQRPTFDPDAPAPCESHTACYVAAKRAHATAERAGYLLAVDRCEYYRGRYQLEEFYGLCLLILADAYRHLDNFAESQACYRRFLDTQTGDTELALQARAELDEVERAARTPYAYHDYLQAVALLQRLGDQPQPGRLERARELLEAARAVPDFALRDKADYLLERIGQVRRAGREPPTGPGRPEGAAAGPADGTPAAADPAADPGIDTAADGAEDRPQRSEERSPAPAGE